VGRSLYAAIFIAGGISDFVQRGAMIAAARSAGVPLADVAVPVAGIIILTGGLSVALGFHGRLGAVLLFVFLVTAALLMHRFWAAADPQAAANQLAHFMKNLALAGAALFIAVVGTGPYSLAR